FAIGCDYSSEKFAACRCRFGVVGCFGRKIIEWALACTTHHGLRYAASCVNGEDGIDGGANVKASKATIGLLLRGDVAQAQALGDARTGEGERLACERGDRLLRCKAIRRAAVGECAFGGVQVEQIADRSGSARL